MEEWWWIHMPIHIIWSLSITLHMFDLDVVWVLVGLQASNTVYWTHMLVSCDSGIELISKIWAWKCPGNKVMMDPYAHPHHIKLIQHLVYAWFGCGMSSGWVASLKHCILDSYVGQLWWLQKWADLKIYENKLSASALVTKWWWIHMPIHRI